MSIKPTDLDQSQPEQKQADDGASPKPGEAGADSATRPAPAARPKEIGGPPGPEPTRYGDWQFNGRVTDF